jgi:hypothetical protein
VHSVAFTFEIRYSAAITLKYRAIFSLTLHTIRRQRTEKPFFVLKIDMMKANRVEWYYFYGCLVKLGFALPLIKSIVRCMTNVRYVVRVNGDLIQSDSYPRYLSGRSDKPLLVLVVQGGFVAPARHTVLHRGGSS